MLGFLFGFNARVARLPFFLAGLGLAVVMTAICFAIAGYIFQHTPRGAEFSIEHATMPVLAAAAFFLWVTFTLQSMRIRDIGWDPVCVIPAWVTILIVDRIVAGKFPAFALGHDHSETAVGGVVNLVFLLVLTFWPSGEHDPAAPPFKDTFSRPTRARSGSVPANRMEQVIKPGSSHAKY